MFQRSIFLLFSVLRNGFIFRPRCKMKMQAPFSKIIKNFNADERASSQVQGSSEHDCTGHMLLVHMKKSPPDHYLLLAKHLSGQSTLSTLRSYVCGLHFCTQSTQTKGKSSNLLCSQYLMSRLFSLVPDERLHNEVKSPRIRPDKRLRFFI